jgi:hypothetical protein
MAWYDRLKLRCQRSVFGKSVCDLDLAQDRETVLAVGRRLSDKPAAAQALAMVVFIAILVQRGVIIVLVQILIIRIK